MNEAVSVTRAHLAAAVTAAGLSDRPVELHSSLSSFGHVVGGADTVVDALLDRGCTVIVPSFANRYLVPASTISANQRPARNGGDLADDVLATREVPRYSTDSTAMNRSEGAIAAAVTARTGRWRGDHPLNSFSAVGPLAEPIIRTQTPTDVYGPLREAAARGGLALLAGVGLDKLTLIHAAEQHAGRKLFVRWANSSDGTPIATRVGSCSNGFERLAPALREYERRTTVGNSLWRMFPMTAVIEVGSAAIRQTPEITRCTDSDCPRCPDAVAGGPVFGR